MKDLEEENTLREVTGRAGLTAAGAHDDPGRVRADRIAIAGQLKLSNASLPVTTNPPCLSE